MEVCCRRSSKKSTAGVRFGTAGVLAETAATTNPHIITFLRVDMIGRRDQSKSIMRTNQNLQIQKLQPIKKQYKLRANQSPGQGPGGGDANHDVFLNYDES